MPVLLLPLSSFDPEMCPAIPGRSIVLHCAVDTRSEAAGKMLLNQGHGDIVHMADGLDMWKAAGFATEVQLLPPGEQEKSEGPVFVCPPPGEILQKEYMEPPGIGPSDLAQRINVLEVRVADVLAGKSPVGVELSLRLARDFSTAADFWIHPQVEHDLERARHSMGEQIRRVIKPRVSSD